MVSILLLHLKLSLPLRSTIQWSLFYFFIWTSPPFCAPPYSGLLSASLFKLFIPTALHQTMVFILLLYLNGFGTMSPDTMQPKAITTTTTTTSSTTIATTTMTASTSIIAPLLPVLPLLPLPPLLPLLLPPQIPSAGFAGGFEASSKPP